MFKYPLTRWDFHGYNLMPYFYPYARPHVLPPSLPLLFTFNFLFFFLLTHNVNYYSYLVF
jgi:hypothetical protein